MRTTVWILGDQLLEQHPALMAAVAEAGGDRLRVVLVESRARAARLPYQRKKLVLLFSAMRHYAAGLQEQGLRGGDLERRGYARWAAQARSCLATSSDLLHGSQ